MQWVDYYLKLADVVAIKSKDPSTTVGAIIIGNDNQVLSTGFNGFARGVEDSSKRYQDRPTKYAFVVHAEMNAILHAARHGVSLRGSRLYVTHPVCQECAKAIIQAGITKVVINESGRGLLLREPWSSQWETTLTMFDEAGIDCLFHKIPEVEETDL